VVEGSSHGSSHGVDKNANPVEESQPRKQILFETTVCFLVSVGDLRVLNHGEHAEHEQ